MTYAVKVLSKILKARLYSIQERRSTFLLHSVNKNKKKTEHHQKYDYFFLFCLNKLIFFLNIFCFILLLSVKEADSKTYNHMHLRS